MSNSLELITQDEKINSDYPVDTSQFGITTEVMSMPKGIYLHTKESRLSRKIGACKRFNKPVDDIDRFWSYVDIKSKDECWEWKALKSGGYGQFRLNGKMQLAHRIAYELTYGKLPEGFCSLHKCDNRPCCNPAHLFRGTVKDNNADREAKGRSADTRGIKHGCAKLTEAEVLEIRAITDEFQRITAKRYGVSRRVIYNVKHRLSWKHI